MCADFGILCNRRCLTTTGRFCYSRMDVLRKRVEACGLFFFHVKIVLKSMLKLCWNHVFQWCWNHQVQAVFLICSLGCIWASNELRDDESPASSLGFVWQSRDITLKGSKSIWVNWLYMYILYIYIYYIIFVLIFICIIIFVYIICYVYTLY